MALFDSSDCARRVKLRLNRPSTDEAFTVTTTDDVIYDFLSESQDRIAKLIAVYVPDAMWTVPTAMSTSDNKTFTFGTDVDTAAIFALGHYRVYAQRSDIPDAPLVPGDEFTVEGTSIRIPNNQTRTFADSGPWVQYVAPSNVITSATQPTIPKLARPAMISDAARRCAEYRLNNGPLAAALEEQFQSDWLEVLSAIKTQADERSASYSGRSTRLTTANLYGVRLR